MFPKKKGCSQRKKGIPKEKAGAPKNLRWHCSLSFGGAN